MKIFGYIITVKKIDDIKIVPDVDKNIVNTKIHVYNRNKLWFTATQEQIWGKEIHYNSVMVGKDEWIKRAYEILIQVGPDNFKYILTGEREK